MSPSDADRAADAQDEARRSGTGGHRSVMESLLADVEHLASIGGWSWDLNTREATWSDEMYRIQGLEPQSVPASAELLLSSVPASDRGYVAALLETVVERPESIPPEGVDIAYRVVRPDGVMRELRAIGRIERDATGRPVRWVGAAQDVTALRLTERELQAYYAVSVALRDWDTFEDGVMGLLTRLGDALDYGYGALWVWDEDQNRLVCRAFWSSLRTPSAAEPTRFELSTRAMEFAPGEGAPGRAWAQGRPIVAADMTADPSFGRPDAARELGLTSGVAIPALTDAAPLAVLTFYSTDRRAGTPSLERTLGAIGRDLGAFLARHRAQLTDRTLSPRELEVLRLAAEGRSGPEIARQLVVSPSTIKTHFEHIYEKLGVGDRAGAVAYALRAGMID
ncbi:MAG: GAF domain-containing protein [Solirubrobacteraceae bacterium]|nr:GAF domain-containing protein [Solirubrobacteraceae bacterium]